MLQITDVPIQSLVIKLRRAGKQSRQEILTPAVDKIVK